MGTIWLGQTSSAADGITEICLGCGLGNGPDYSDDMPSFTLGLNTLGTLPNFGGIGSYGNRAFGNGAFVGEGDRREILRYISPEMAGFVFSTAVGPDDFYDFALRYANEFNGVRVAGGIGYQRSTSGVGQQLIAEGSCQNGAFWGTVADKDCENIGLSASVQHVASGVYVAGAWGQATDRLALAGFGDKATNWHITGGVNKKWSPLGSTNIWGMYTKAENEIGGLSIVGESSELTIYGVGIEQSIDAAAMNLYLWYKHFDAEYNFAGVNFQDGTSDQVVIGARVRF
jgi:hypothetical protein